MDSSGGKRVRVRAVSTLEKRPRAVVVGVELQGVGADEHRSSLEELGRLAHTLGLDVVAEVTQKRTRLAPGCVLGEGKLKELAQFTGGKGVLERGPRSQKRTKAGAHAKPAEEEVEEDEVESDDESGLPALAPDFELCEVVLVDHDLSPSQARNLERATGAEVLDRTSIILSIFQRHARTREARLQVEIAQLVYQAPRLREQGAGTDRQRGGIGGKGAGESSIELDRRRIRDRISQLRQELALIEGDDGTRRRRRATENTVALVGYTNAGKSSLMRALTGSEVYVADKLFATLGTTVRALQPETKPRILVSDTVGFIKKLPHDLVASFRSTLDEAREAHLLLHLVDASDPAFDSQRQVTREVLDDMKVDTATWLVFNKVDRIDEARLAELKGAFPDALFMSAHRPEDVAALREKLAEHFAEGYEEREIFVPYAHSKIVAEAHANAQVLEEKHGEEGTTLRVRGPVEVIAALDRLRGASA